ncbi:hypothetical protein [Paenibacillus hamazuiensis]|uniref:hypothetical protein n=1 Tax=Paenibacillus hamazuiensis TaxID=2936508 RepID=UPI00200E9096|nr:hypothetical protein [Paenibacillus hamazuiensis]
MVRTLHALADCQAGDQVKIHNDRVPMFLIEELKQLRYLYTVELQSDGSAIILIRSWGGFTGARARFRGLKAQRLTSFGNRDGRLIKCQMRPKNG